MPPAPTKRRPNNPATPPSIDAALYSNIGRYSGAVVLTVFEQIGGVTAMADWAKENPTDFYKSVFTKVISAPKEVNITGKLTIEDAVKALDLEEGTGYTIVDDNPDVEEE